MRAHFFQKLIFYRLIRPKLTCFVYNFKSFPMVHVHFILSCGALVFFPQNEYLPVFFKKKIFKSDCEAQCYSKVCQSSKMLYCSSRNLRMRFKLRFYHSTQCRRDAAFHVFGKKKMKRNSNAKFRLRLISASRKRLWFCARISILRAKSTL